MPSLFVPVGDFSGVIIRLEPRSDKRLVTIRQHGDSQDRTFTGDELVGIFVTQDCVRLLHEFSLSPSGKLQVVKCMH